MVDLSAEWSLVVTTIGLVLATVGLLWFTRTLSLETRVLANAVKALTDQVARRVEVAKVQIMTDAAASGRPPPAIDEI